MMHGSKGIMANKSMYIPNDNTQISHPVDYKLWLKRLDSKLNEQTNQNSRKVMHPLNKKRYHKFWGIM